MTATVTWRPWPTVERISAAAVRPLLVRLADDIVTDARRLCPVDSGDLRSTIRGDVLDGGVVEITAGGRVGELTGRFVDYAGFVEYGTGRGPAQPFLRPAVHRSRTLRP